MNKQEIDFAITQLRKENESFSKCKHGLYSTEILTNELAILALEQQLNNGWIPVSEKLPDSDKSFKVYVTLRYKDNGYIFVDMMRWFFSYFEWFNGKRLSEKYEVIAWMKVNKPEPYKEVSE